MSGTTTSSDSVVALTAGTASATRVADVLLLFLEAQPGAPLGVTEIGRRLQLSKSVVHRILVSLENRDLLEFRRDARAYVIGTALLQLAVNALKDLDLRRAAAAQLQELQARSGETVTLSALVGLKRLYIDQVVSTQPIRLTVEIGSSWPLHAGASGKAILAFLEPTMQQLVLAQSSKLAGSRAIDEEALEAELSRIREVGVASSRSERYIGSASVAAPILDATTRVVGALSVGGPEARFSEQVVEELKPLVLGSAQLVSEKLDVPSLLIQKGR